MFHQSSTGSSITFATPPGDSGYPTTIGSAGSTFGANTTFSANATVNGVLDVTNRRTNASLSSAGWYRVLTFSGAGANSYQNEGLTIHFDITTTFNSNANATHSIDLQAVNGAVRFVDEQSAGSNIVDKIRYTASGNYAYIDIHYAGTNTNGVSVCFSVACRAINQYRFTANSLESVDDAPNGEKVLTTYIFVANTFMDGTITVGPGATSLLESRAIQRGKVVQISGAVSGSFTAGTTGYAIANVSGVAGPSNGVWRGVGGCGSQAYYAYNSAYILFDASNGIITARVSTNCSCITFNFTYVLS